MTRAERRVFWLLLGFAALTTVGWLAASALARWEEGHGREHRHPQVSLLRPEG